jgi:opacity protein-like surface antigen
MRKLLTVFTFVLGLALVSGTAFAQDESGEGGADEEESEMTDSSSSEPGDGSTGSKYNDASAASEESDMDSSREASEVSEPVVTMESEEETDTGGDSRRTSGHPSVENSFVVGPHVGGQYPAFSDLGFWGMFGLEIGYQPPIDGRPLEIAVIGRYTQPGAEGSGEDPSLGDGGAEYSWELTQRQLILDLVGIYRFRGVSESLHPYAMAGPRMNLMRAKLSAEGNGADFGETRETNTEYGFVVGGGMDYRLGPGTLFGELKFGWTQLDQTLTGPSNTGSFVLDLGYRFFPF